jgi:hypothetical protein
MSPWAFVNPTTPQAIIKKKNVAVHFNISLSSGLVVLQRRISQPGFTDHDFSHAYNVPVKPGYRTDRPTSLWQAKIAHPVQILYVSFHSMQARAIRLDEHGGPEVLGFVDIELP